MSYPESERDRLHLPQWFPESSTLDPEEVPPPDIHVWNSPGRLLNGDLADDEGPCTD